MSDIFSSFLNNVEGRVDGDGFNDGTIASTWMGDHDETDPGMAYADLLQLDVVNLRRLTPFQPGRAYFIPVKMPRFMELEFERETDFFRHLLTVYAIGVDGIQDPATNFSEVTSGLEGQTMEIATGRTGFTNELTFNFPTDFRGQFITKYLNKWQDGIVDPGTGVCHYFGAEEDGDPLDPSNSNHTMSGVYFTLDPSERQIEYCAYIFNMMPKSAQDSINNYTKGESAPVNLTSPFTAQLITRNEQITNLAYENLRDTIAENRNGTTSMRDDINVNNEMR